MSYKILIIDDEPNNIEVMINVLAQKNYNILIASNATEGCKIANQNNPNLIIMDWEMPDMNGIDAIKTLKQNPQTALIPIIMATGVMLDSEHLKTALEAGAIDYIRKPIDEIELLARANSAIMLFEEMKKNIELQTELIRKENEIAQKEILNNKQALAKLTLRIIQNNELNARLFDQLNQVSQNSNQTGKKVISKIISNFKADAKNINWQEFDLLFEQVHRSFYDNISKKYPDLTANEHKLCIFYKLNLNSKEICSLTLQNENALKKARARLRKRFNLEPEQSLHQFLQQFI
ncbi:MAG: response regulator [Bacteroidales bacterium]|nr:response regulator [Bacteroidales bacterium]